MTSMLLLLCLSATAPADTGQMPAKKLIATGWDMPDTARLRANLAEIEARPFQGLVVRVPGGEGHPTLTPTFTAQPWERAWYDAAVADAKAAASGRLTDNFISTGANAGNVDWFDDAGWEAIVGHFRIAAAVAKEGGFRGLLFDPEPYTQPYRAFDYTVQPQQAEHTFAEYRDKARQRGREVMAAIAAEYPDLVLFTYFMNSVNTAAASQPNPERTLATSGYGLYPSFIDGWLDAAPPTVTFVDGCEHAYLYNSELQYLTAANRIKGACQNLVAPENRAKYRAQVQASFGIYLDAYVNQPPSTWRIELGEQTPLGKLSENVRAALAAADEYVWVYGEKYRWWPTPNQGVKPESWEQVMPGIESALAVATDPVGWGRRRLAELGDQVPNLIVNGDFGAETVTLADGTQVTARPDGPPAAWSSWQMDPPTGTFTWDRQVGAAAPGAGRIAAVRGGCLIQVVPVQPGERYAVQAKRKVAGQGDASIRVRWQTADTKWFDETQDVFVWSDDPREAWGDMVGVVTIPATVTRLVVLLGAAGQMSEADQAWYDDVRVVKLD